VLNEFEIAEKKDLKLLKKAILAVDFYLSQFIKVDRFPFSIASGASCGSISSVPANVTGSFSEIDLVILVVPVTSDENSKMLSKGKVCVFDSGSINRPVLGRIDINYEEYLNFFFF